MYHILLENGEDAPGVEGKLLFSKYDLQCVLQNGMSLLGSEGAQFNQDEKLAGKIIIKKTTYVLNPTWVTTMFSLMTKVKG